MALVADALTLRAVLRYQDLPASGVSSGDRIIVASLGQVARWSGSAWVLSPVGQSAGVADLNQDISNSFVEAEVQAISDKVDEILAALRTAGLMAT